MPARHEPRPTREAAKTTLPQLWRRWARLAVAASAAFVLVAAAGSAHAAVYLAAPPSFPSALATGQSGVPAALRIINTSDGNQASQSTLIEAVTLVPSCGTAIGPSGNCPAGYMDPGVLRLSSTAVGRSGTACAGLTFAVAVVDAAQGKYLFTPARAFSVGASTDPRTLASVTDGSNTCTIDFTVDVLRAPALDSSPSLPGLQTGQISAVAGRTGDGTPGAGTGSSQVTIAAAAPVPAPAAPPPAQRSGGNGQPATAAATLAVRWAKSSRAQIASTFGRHDTAIGRLLTPAGTPIAGAQITVLATPMSLGAASAQEGTATTGADGAFAWARPANESSRTLTFIYYAYTGDTTPAAVAQLRVLVPAKLQLTITPRITHVGGTITIRGQLSGGGIPPAGKQIGLEAHGTGRAWVTFRVVRTNGLGAFTTRYRFQTAGPADYTFRAVSRIEADYPFLTGHSNRVVVHER